MYTFFRLQGSFYGLSLMIHCLDLGGGYAKKVRYQFGLKRKLICYRYIEVQINLFKQHTNLTSNIFKAQLLSQLRVSQMEIEMNTYRPRYSTLNVYTSPRVFQQKIDHTSRPLCIYTGSIEANNRTPEVAYLRKIDQADGLIYQFSQMNARPKDPQLGNKPLGIKILICVCMYNESKNAINLTLSGIYNNLEYLEEEGFSSEEIGVVLIQDGILKLVADRKKRTYAKGKNSMVEFYRQLDRYDGKPRCDLEERINVILEEIENFNKKGMSSQVAQNNDFPPTIEKNISFLYQNLWHPGMTDIEKRIQSQILGKPYTKRLKIFSCFKHLNGTKLSSHLWFFEGFCRYLDPRFIVLLDVGTQPDDSGIVNLIKGFYNRNGTEDEDVGGTTGLMNVDPNFPSEQGGQGKEEEEGCCSRTFFSIQRAQEYQYIIAHFLDKNAESTLGFLHVLPGAWSAYRYRALIKSDEYQPNLLEHSYFKMTLNPQIDVSGYQQANMYLAEDRILSLGIYCQPKSQFYLRYIPNAGARTDPMKSHEDLMKQRRRWINSSLFAFLYVFKNYYFNSGESNHSAFDRYVKLNLSMILALLSFATSYLTPAIYFYVLYSTIIQIDVSSFIVNIVAKVAAVIYIVIYLIAIAGGLSGSLWTKYAQNISRIFALITFAMLGLVTYNVLVIYFGIGQDGLDFNNFNQMSVLVIAGVNVVGLFLIIFAHFLTHPRLVCRMLCDTFSYWYYQGAYSQTIVAHAFCNVDDVSWGTKGSTTKQGGKAFQTDKVFFVSTWIFWNSLLAYIFIYLDIVINQPGLGPRSNRRIVLIAIAIYGTMQMLIKILLALWHHLKFHLTCCFNTLEPGRKEKVDALWSRLYRQYKEIQQMSLNRESHSHIIQGASQTSSKRC